MPRWTTCAERRRRKVRALRRRDGDLCCWCHLPMDFSRIAPGNQPTLDGATLEHIVPSSCGGSDHLDNLALAHRRCNQGRNGIARPPLPDVQVAA